MLILCLSYLITTVSQGFQRSPQKYKELFHLVLSFVSKIKTDCVAFSEYMNFIEFSFLSFTKFIFETESALTLTFETRKFFVLQQDKPSKECLDRML